MQEVGTILESEDGYYVVVETRDGQAVILEKIEKYVSKIVVLDFEGEKRTLQEIVEMAADEYMSKNKVIRLND